MIIMSSPPLMFIKSESLTFLLEKYTGGPVTVEMKAGKLMNVAPGPWLANYAEMWWRQVWIKSQNKILVDAISFADVQDLNHELAPIKTVGSLSEWLFTGDFIRQKTWILPPIANNKLDKWQLRQNIVFNNNSWGRISKFTHKSSRCVWVSEFLNPDIDWSLT